MWPFKTSRERQLETELDAVKADRERIRGERNQFKQDRDTARHNREQALRQLAEAGATNRRVHERNLELGRRISKLTESDPEYAAQLERRLHRMAKAAARYLAASWKAHAENVDLAFRLARVSTEATDLTQRVLAAEERARTAKLRADVEGRPVDGASAATAVESRLRAELARSEKARGALEEHCRVLQAANEVDARALRALREGAKS
jgi:uncharacterized protein (DUF3084 family)